MYNKETVFILGAGASCHYGYPTGEQLIVDMLRAADVIDSYLQAIRNYGQMGEPTFIHHIRSLLPHLTPQATIDAVRNQIADFKGRVNATDPIVIDYFLGHNFHLADLGRLLIAYVLHERESETTSQGKFVRDHNNNWIRFITARLAAGCETSADLLKNRIRFVTFNYDVSLEEHLYSGLSGLSFFDAIDIQRFLAEDRIVHVYGSLSGARVPRFPIDFEPIHRLDPSSDDRGELIRDGVAARKILDITWESAKSLKIIDPTHKEEGGEDLGWARNWITSADHIYILGYGFDANNNKRIGLADLKNTPRPERAILFTNFNASNRISKIAGSMFLSNYSAFINGPMYGSPATGAYFEMSVRNVYEALSVDFDDMGG